MSSAPILYSFRRCPYAMRARMALLASQTRVELREIKLSAKPEAMVTASPKATVPVLVLPDGTVIDESLAIMDWALVRHDPGQWRSGIDAALVEANDGAFKTHLDRYKYPERHGSDPIEHRTAGLAFLQSLDARLAARRQLHGDMVSLTDIAIFPFVRQFAATDAAWFAVQPLPQLQAWLTGHIGSALFTEAMLRHPVWRAGDPPVWLNPPVCS